MKKLRIVFAGTPEFTLPCLQAIANSGHRLLAVYTQPDRPAGRGRKLKPSAVKNWAIAQQLPVYQPLNFKDEKAVADLIALQPDLLVVIAYGLILPPGVLAIPPLGCINVHASLLPRWRGASPIQQAILQGDHQTGVTIMQMDAGMDTGDKLAEVSCPINTHDTAKSLHDKLAEIAAAPLIETINALAEGRAKPIPQETALVTYAGKIKKEDAAINWKQTALEIDRQIRALNPWPIAFTYADEELVRIHQASVVDHSFTAEPGTILSIDKRGLLIATAKNALMVKTIQFAGSKTMSIADWLNANRTQLRTHLVLR